MKDKLKFITTSFWSAGQTEYAVIPSDGEQGMIIGHWEDVLALKTALDILVESRETEETIDENDERLDRIWLTIVEASEQYGVSIHTVQKAITSQAIKGVKKQKKPLAVVKTQVFGLAQNRI